MVVLVSGFVVYFGGFLCSLVVYLCACLSLRWSLCFVLSVCGFCCAVVCGGDGCAGVFVVWFCVVLWIWWFWRVFVFAFAGGCFLYGVGLACLCVLLLGARSGLHVFVMVECWLGLF